MISIDSFISFILEEGSFVSQTAAKTSAVLAHCAFSEMPNISMWAEGWRVVEQVPAGSLCNALTWFKKLDRLDAEEMLALARNRFPLSQSLLMVCCRMGYFCNCAPSNTSRRGSAGTEAAVPPRTCPAALACLCVFRRECLACGHRQND